MYFAGCMKKCVRLAAALAVCLALFASVCAQTKDEKAASANEQGKAQAKTSTQTPELAEATEMSAKVVQLYSEQLYDQALVLAKRVLEIREQALSPDDVLIDEALYNLAEIYISKGMNKEAEPYYLRMLAHYERAYGTEHPKTAKVLERLAYISYRMEKLDESEKRITRALAIYEKSPGTSPEKLASLTLEVADLYHAKKDYNKAEATYLRAYELSSHLKEPPDSKEESLATKAYNRYICFLYETKSLKDAQKIEHRLSEEARKGVAGKEREADDEVLKGRALALPQPEYPPIAVTNRVRGVVRVHVIINERGEVTEANVICGPVLLRAAAVAAAHGARFTPTLLSGQPVKVSGVINYNFRLTR